MMKSPQVGRFRRVDGRVPHASSVLQFKRYTQNIEARSLPMTAPIIIFGANGGIGEALARRLARAGAPLFLTGRSAEKIAPLAEELKARYGLCDVLDETAVSNIVQEAGQEGDGL